MARTKISEFSATPANNTDIDSINIAEGCAPSGINDAIRELMAQLKDFQTGAAGDSFNGPVGTTTAAAGAFTNLTASGTLGVTGATTLSSALTYGGVTLSNAVTGTGSMVLSNSPTLVTPALGTPASGVVTNLTGTASININGTVGATTATTGAFTTLAASGAVTLSGGTANGVTYLNGSKVLTSGSALVFDGSNLGIGTSSPAYRLDIPATGAVAAYLGGIRIGANGTDIVGDIGPLSIQTLGANYVGLSTNGTERARIDPYGNLGLGVTPSAWIGSYRALNIGDSGLISSRTGVSINNVEVGVNWFRNTGGSFVYKANGFGTNYTQADGAHLWYTAPSGTAGNAISFTQAMTLDASGNLLVGTTSFSLSPSQGFVVQNTSGASISVGHANGTPTGFLYANFAYNSTQVGSIVQNGTTGVLYNLTSDYRLKNNTEALTGSGEFIDALQPKKWQWWDGSGEGVGFIAHEFMEVAKYSGSGEKDAVGADGKPMYQSIQPSSSEVIANLVAEIQSLRQRLAALESK